MQRVGVLQASGYFIRFNFLLFLLALLFYSALLATRNNVGMLTVHGSFSTIRGTSLPMDVAHVSTQLVSIITLDTRSCVKRKQRARSRSIASGALERHARPLFPCAQSSHDVRLALGANRRCTTGTFRVLEYFLPSGSVLFGL